MSEHDPDNPLDDPEVQKLLQRFDEMEEMEGVSHLSRGSYVLEDGKPRPARNFLEAAIAMGEHKKRRVDFTMVNDDVEVSTVFVGIVSGCEEHPRLFETMIFGGEYTEAQWKWRTMAEAKEGHWEIVTALREGKNPHDCSCMG